MNLQQRLKERLYVQGKERTTFKTYWYWCDKFLQYCKRNGIGKETRAEEAVERWLTWLAVKQHLGKNSQNVALQAVCYLYREVFNRPLEGVSAFRSKRPVHAREVLDVSEVAALINELEGLPLYVAKMIYGCGLRIGEVFSLRVKDVSFERCQLHIHAAKGDKGRLTSFPGCLHDMVREQIERARKIHAWDQKHNPNGVSLPGRYRQKNPAAARSFGWYFLLVSDNLSQIDGGPLCRHHKHPGHISGEFGRAAARAGVLKRTTPHILRHSYATHSNEQGIDMRVLQQLLGHNDIKTTETYVHTNKDRATASRSPMDNLAAMLAAPPPQGTEKPFRLRVVG